MRFAAETVKFTETHDERAPLVRIDIMFFPGHQQLLVHVHPNNGHLERGQVARLMEGMDLHEPGLQLNAVKRILSVNGGRRCPKPWPELLPKPQPMLQRCRCRIFADGRSDALRDQLDVPRQLAVGNAADIHLQQDALVAEQFVLAQGTPAGPARAALSGEPPTARQIGSAPFAGRGMIRALFSGRGTCPPRLPLPRGSA